MYFSLGVLFSSLFPEKCLALWWLNIKTSRCVCKRQSSLQHVAQEKKAEISSVHSAMRILRKTSNQSTADSLILHMYEGYKLYKPHGTICEIMCFLKITYV